jgi:hypothetical protein
MFLVNGLSLFLKILCAKDVFFLAGKLEIACDCNFDPIKIPLSITSLSFERARIPKKVFYNSRRHLYPSGSFKNS